MRVGPAVLVAAVEPAAVAVPMVVVETVVATVVASA
jgi:hypothetical protein